MAHDLRVRDDFGKLVQIVEANWPNQQAARLDVVSMHRIGQTWTLLVGEELAAFTELVRQQTARSAEQN